MENLLRQIDHRIATKKMENMKKELQKMENDLAFYDLQIRDVNKSFDTILLKNKPVGNSIKAIRYIKKNEYCNCSS
jgi:hypothetical protein